MITYKLKSSIKALISNEKGFLIGQWKSNSRYIKLIDVNEREVHKQNIFYACEQNIFPILREKFDSELFVKNVNHKGGWTCIYYINNMLNEHILYFLKVRNVLPKCLSIIGPNGESISFNIPFKIENEKDVHVCLSKDLLTVALGYKTNLVIYDL